MVVPLRWGHTPTARDNGRGFSRDIDTFDESNGWAVVFGCPNVYWLIGS